MSRRGKAVERKLVPDPVYHDTLVTEFINTIMRRGKKSIAEKIFYGAMETIRNKSKEEPLEVVKKAIKNASPLLEVKSRRVGGANYQVPVEVSAKRQQSLAIRWLVQFARERSEHMMAERIALEILDAADNKGNTIKKREDVHRMAEANRAFAHYRW
jgi:small subunit ribosomal protein S7